MMRSSLLLLALMAALFLVTFGAKDVEAIPSIESITPQVVNLDLHPESSDFDWRNNSYYFENHNYNNSSNHTWIADTECNDTGSGCDAWDAYGTNPGFVLNTAGESNETIFWGPDVRSEFQMYYNGGTASLITENYDLSNFSETSVMFLKHRYNYDVDYGGYPSYNGGQVQISADNGTTWNLLIPDIGYPGRMLNNSQFGNPLYGQPGFVHCGDCSGVSGAAEDNEDKWIVSTFSLSEYADSDNVKFRFIVGMYGYQYPGDGEHWNIDDFGLSSASPIPILTFDGNSSEDYGDLTEYRWNSSIDGVFAYTEDPHYILNSQLPFSLGNHTISFSIRENETSNWSSNYSWMMVLRSPRIQWLNGPSNLSNEALVTIEFNVSTIVNYTTQCNFDDTAWMDCNSVNHLTNFSYGNHSFAVNATDQFGYRTISFWNWTKYNIKPEAFLFLEPGLVDYGQPVNFSGSGIDDNHTIDRFEWISDLDGIFSTSQNFTYSNLSAGIHNISLRVSDSEGLWSDSKNDTLIVNIRPVAYAGENISTTPNVLVIFHGTGVDEDGEVVLYEWDFDGDGIYDWADEFNGRELNSYNQTGTYTAVLRVTDNDGSTATASRVITVSKAGDGGGGGDDGGGGLPAPSLAAAVAAVAVIALRRRPE